MGSKANEQEGENGQKQSHCTNFPAISQKKSARRRFSHDFTRSFVLQLTPCMSLFSGLLNKTITTAKATSTSPMVENTSM